MSQLIRRVAKKGFTLIELMIVVAIIGILAAIAIPKFADLITKSRESSVKGSLGSVRGALTIYYSDLEGTWPNTLAVMTGNGRYLDKVPSATIPAAGNPVSPGHVRNDTHIAAVNDANDASWVYVNTSGLLNVNCTHKDTKGSTWSVW
jgi:prepilin-type N-terminal cleavage/methylation domain-containing protein